MSTKDPDTDNSIAVTRADRTVRTGRYYEFPGAETAHKARELARIEYNRRRSRLPDTVVVEEASEGYGAVAFEEAENA